MDFLKQYLSIKEYELFFNQNIVNIIREDIKSMRSNITKIEKDIEFECRNNKYFNNNAHDLNANFDLNSLLFLENYLNMLQKDIQRIHRKIKDKEKIIEEKCIEIQSDKKIYDNLNNIYNKYLKDKKEKIEEKEINEMIELYSIHKYINNLNE